MAVCALPIVDRYHKERRVTVLAGLGPWVRVRVAPRDLSHLRGEMQEMRRAGASMETIGRRYGTTAWTIERTLLPRLSRARRERSRP